MTFPRASLRPHQVRRTLPVILGLTALSWSVLFVAVQGAMAIVRVIA